MLDLANQSFNAILPPVTPSPALLPAAPFTTVSQHALGFTPFSQLNTSPPRDRLSFKLTCAEGDSPLTYSPGQKDATIEDVLWGDIKGFLGVWDLDDEVRKYRDVDDSAGKEEGLNGTQECWVKI